MKVTVNFWTFTRAVLMGFALSGWFLWFAFVINVITVDPWRLGVFTATASVFTFFINALTEG